MSRGVPAIALIVSLAALAACTTTPAPVIDRSEEPASVRLERDGHYRVRRGDTLHAIAFRYGLDHRDIARWNGIGPPYLIYPDQVLRLSPPRDAQAGGGSTAPPSRPSAVKPPPVKAAEKSPAATPQVSPQPPERAAVEPGDPQAWLWPVTGRILRGFLANDPSRNGLDIAGREGEPVKATAPGTVVYSGNGLIGFGELIIVKHSERMLSAYAHNRLRLVQEGEQVKAGQKIAELGRNDRNEALLHFEIRVNGKPVDPRRFLP